MEVSLENCSSISYGKQGLFHSGQFPDIALLTEFYLVHYINSISSSFFPAHLCCCGSSEKMCREGLMLVVMWGCGGAVFDFKKKEVIPEILREYSRVHIS